MDPFSPPCSFQNLLNSQQPNTSFSFVTPSIELSSDASVFGTQWAEDANEEEHIVSDRKERRKWSPTEDLVLINSWLNISKDPVVGNEQKAIAFWKWIAAYVASSQSFLLCKRESHVTVSKGGGRSTTVYVSLLDVMKLQQKLDPVG
uniref:Myb-like domain-containing protein n=1 Tax=Brassica oleracea TaxID=3712 RepID=A0A3P6FQL4_BRAOL|nr:unnamed protein product [Brassica oleracea]